MGLAPSWRVAVAVSLLSLSLSSCLVRRRLVTRQGKHDTRPLRSATVDELTANIRARFDSVRSFSATMDMTPSLGSVYKGEITEFAGVRGFVLFRQPDEMRIIGLDPVIHTHAFDMVSMGPDFKVHLPSKNRFVEGRNDAPATSANKLENLRPIAFLQALMIHPPEPATETAVLEDDTDEDHALYILLILNKQNGRTVLARSVTFDRQTLEIVRQKIFNAAAVTISDTRYTAWKIFDGISFPSSIDINRPQDGYGVVMTVTKMQMNLELGADKFELVRPEGTQLQVIGPK